MDASKTTFVGACPQPLCALLAGLPKSRKSKTIFWEQKTAKIAKPQFLASLAGFCSKEPCLVQSRFLRVAGRSAQVEEVEDDLVAQKTAKIAKPQFLASLVGFCSKEPCLVQSRFLRVAGRSAQVEEV